MQGAAQPLFIVLRLPACSMFAGDLMFSHVCLLLRSSNLPKTSNTLHDASGLYNSLMGLDYPIRRQRIRSHAETDLPVYHNRASYLLGGASITISVTITRDGIVIDKRFRKSIKARCKSRARSNRATESARSMDRSERLASSCSTAVSHTSGKVHFSIPLACALYIVIT